MDRRVDLAIAVSTALFGVLVLVVAQSIKPFGPVVDPLGPSTFPRILGTVLALSGAAIAIQRLRHWRAEPGHMVRNDGEPDEPTVPASATRAFVVMGLSVAYVLTMSMVGYVIGTPLYIGLALRTMGVRSPLALTLLAVGYTAITYLIFSQVVHVRLPLGPLQELFRGLGLAR